MENSSVFTVPSEDNNALTSTERSAPAKHPGVAHATPGCIRGASVVRPWCVRGASGVLAPLRGVSGVRPWCVGGAKIRSYFLASTPDAPRTHPGRTTDAPRTHHGRTPEWRAPLRGVSGVRPGCFEGALLSVSHLTQLETNLCSFHLAKLKYNR